LVGIACGAATIDAGRTRRESDMSTAPDGNRFAPPAAHVEDVAEPVASGELAGRWSRLGATLIDGILAGIVFWCVSLFTPFNAFRPALQNGLVVAMVENALAGFVVVLVLHGYLLQTRGQTIGKLLLHVRIVRSDGSRATLARLAGLRYFVNSALTLIPWVGWFYALIDVLMIFRQSHKCLHDDIADTIVVKA
jgi:uncharacterized RDD family membrane protein YckC